MLLQLFEHIGGGELVQRIVADLLQPDLVDVDFTDFPRWDAGAVGGIDDDEFARFFFGEKQVEEDVPDRSPRIDAERPLWNLVALFQVAYDFRTEPVVPDQRVASAEDEAVVFIDWFFHNVRIMPNQNTCQEEFCAICAFLGFDHDTEPIPPSVHDC
jgi:hypothetical protein